MCYSVIDAAIKRGMVLRAQSKREVGMLEKSVTELKTMVIETVHERCKSELYTPK